MLLKTGVSLIFFFNFFGRSSGREALFGTWEMLTCIQDANCLCCDDLPLWPSLPFCLPPSFPYTLSLPFLSPGSGLVRAWLQSQALANHCCLLCSSLGAAQHQPLWVWVSPRGSSCLWEAGLCLLAPPNSAAYRVRQWQKVPSSYMWGAARRVTLLCLQEERAALVGFTFLRRFDAQSQVWWQVGPYQLTPTVAALQFTSSQLWFSQSEVSGGVVTAGPYVLWSSNMYMGLCML